MDGENHGKPYCLMDDLGGKNPCFGNTHIVASLKTNRQFARENGCLEDFLVSFWGV